MRRTWSRMAAHDEAGLTLAEMLLVLAILALVAGLVVGRGLPGQGTVRSAALVAFVRDARSGAIETGRGVTLLARGQRIEGAGPGFDLGPGWLVQMDREIRFLPDGSSNGGTITILPPDGGSYGVGVAPVSGTVLAR